MEAEVKQLPWEKIKEEVIIHTKVERVLTKNKVAIQAHHVGNQPTLCYINCPMFGFQSLSLMFEFVYIRGLFKLQHCVFWCHYLTPLH